MARPKMARIYIYVYILIIKLGGLVLDPLPPDSGGHWAKTQAFHRLYIYLVFKKEWPQIYATHKQSGINQFLNHTTVG